MTSGMQMRFPAVNWEAAQAEMATTRGEGTGSLIWLTGAESRRMSFIRQRAAVHRNRCGFDLGVLGDYRGRPLPRGSPQGRLWPDLSFPEGRQLPPSSSHQWRYRFYSAAAWD